MRRFWIVLALLFILVGCRKLSPTPGLTPVPTQEPKSIEPQIQATSQGGDIMLTNPQEVVENMQPGSVIVDLAASSGGNCELTENNKVITRHGVTIIGQSGYPSQMPRDASKMFGKNLTNFLDLLITEDGNLNLDFNDEIVKGTCITHQGEIYNERVKSIIE